MRVDKRAARCLLGTGLGLTMVCAVSLSGADRGAAGQASASALAQASCHGATQIARGRSKPVTVCQAILAVSAQANIFGAGRRVAPAPGGGGGGLLPPVYRFSARGGQVVTFPTVTGRISASASLPLFDANGTRAATTDIRSFAGISGIEDRTRTFFLVGVFMDSAPAHPPAPPRLDFTGAEGFTPLAPQLNQTFYIGDGKGHSYEVPARATRLFLGFADAPRGHGAPGWYSDNRGSLAVMVSLTY